MPPESPATATDAAREADMWIPISVLEGHDMLIGPCKCGAWHQGEHAVAEIVRLRWELTTFKEYVGIASGNKS